MIPASFTRNFSPILSLRVKVQGTGQIIKFEDHAWCSVRSDEKTALISYKFYVSGSELDLHVKKLNSSYSVKATRFKDKNHLTPTRAKVYHGQRVLFNVQRGIALEEAFIPPRHSRKPILKAVVPPIKTVRAVSPAFSTVQIENAIIEW